MLDVGSSLNGFEIVEICYAVVGLFGYGIFVEINGKVIV